jgi:hypothetical protein
MQYMYVMGFCNGRAALPYHKALNWLDTGLLLKNMRQMMQQFINLMRCPIGLQERIGVCILSVAHIYETQTDSMPGPPLQKETCKSILNRLHSREVDIVQQAFPTSTLHSKVQSSHLSVEANPGSAPRLERGSHHPNDQLRLRLRSCNGSCPCNE